MGINLHKNFTKPIWFERKTFKYEKLDCHQCNSIEDRGSNNSSEVGDILCKIIYA